jgi:hypothetical protein
MTIEISQTRAELELRRLSQLREAINGQVITPGDLGYDAARLAWNLAVNQYPGQ